MGKRVVDDATLSGMADHIREKTGKADPLVLPEGFNAGVDEVFAAGENSGWYTGFDLGMTEGQEIGERAGKKAEYDRIWDAYQQNGNRTNYRRAFPCEGWTDETFRPKYNMQPVNAADMFGEAKITDLKGILEECGVTLDFSKATTLTYPFANSTITRLGVVDTTACVNLGSVLNSASELVSVDRLILKADGSQSITEYTFQATKALVDIVIEGVIGTGGANFRHSTKLSKASITSVVNALSTTKSGLSVTFSKTAVNNAFTDAEWAALVATRKNWTVNLV